MFEGEEENMLQTMTHETNNWLITIENTEILSIQLFTTNIVRRYLQEVKRRFVETRQMNNNTGNSWVSYTHPDLLFQVKHMISCYLNLCKEANDVEILKQRKAYSTSGINVLKHETSCPSLTGENLFSNFLFLNC